MWRVIERLENRIKELDAAELEALSNAEQGSFNSDIELATRCITIKIELRRLINEIKSMEVLCN